ncbi:acetyl-CoA synthetase-like protein, partial [Lindgomyces ingoldianus]
DFLSHRNRLQLEKWNEKPLEQVKQTIHGVIRETMQRCSENEACASWDGSLSYQDLHDHASRIASHLINQGVGPEVIVPLFFEKSKWNLVAMLSVLYAGGAFLPLDPANPKQRLQYLVESTNANILLCS